LSEKVAAKAVFAYTPGLKVKALTVIQKTRRLPLPGNILVKKGETVSFDAIVARTSIPGEPVLINVAGKLGFADNPSDLPIYMTKKVGDKVSEGEEIAKYSTFFGLMKKFCYSPIDGSIETASSVTGSVIIRAPPVPVEVNAYIPGNIVGIIPEQGVTVETRGAFLQGIFGIGGETHGIIEVIAKSQDDVLEADMITAQHMGKILVGGSIVTKDALIKGAAVGVKGIVVGGIEDEDLIEFVGEEIGVAITGQEDLGLTLIITEGFGQMKMSTKSFDLLNKFDGFEACITGATQIRAGVMRPEIIIPLDVTEEITEEELRGGMQVNTPVRIIREPFFGEIGECVSFPIELEKMQSESSVRVLNVKLVDGRTVTVPRANVEIIEE
jgi:hypothetical protein